ncbi:Profilin [Macleaya cordata]|uniref:Profilin n=1 Tax=Macleaya cordata TaxID=56857 RepID=A0A200PSJ5_MACCD|nr:Profilin [Macleaya cordata]
MDWGFSHRVWEKWVSSNVGSSGEPLKAALLLNYDPTGPSRLVSIIAEQQGIKAKPVELSSFLEFIKQNNLQGECFFIGSNEYMVTSIHESWFCARCVNTSKPAGEGAIVMQTTAFLLVALYDGSIGSASRAMVAVDQTFPTKKTECKTRQFKEFPAAINTSLQLHSHFGEDIICLWNPSTKEYKVIPSTPIEHPRGSGILHSIRYGFGYDSKIEDYKLVRIADFLAYGHSYDSEVKIYTLGSNSWRRIQDIPYNFTFGSKSGALVNGTLHWIANRREASRLILSLDIRDETFREVPRPEYLNDQFHITIGVLGGWLCILDQYLDTVGVEVWVMKDYGVRGSWTKLYTITLQTVIQSFQYLTLVQSLKNGVILLKDNNALVLYDPKHERAGILKIPGIPEWFEPVTYVESLVSLNSCTCVGQEQTDEAIEQKIRSL